MIFFREKQLKYFKPKSNCSKPPYKKLKTKTKNETIDVSTLLTSNKRNEICYFIILIYNKCEYMLQH